MERHPPITPEQLQAAALLRLGQATLLLLTDRQPLNGPHLVAALTLMAERERAPLERMAMVRAQEMVVEAGGLPPSFGPRSH